jgi:outer membrane lipoprotein LolB
LNACLSRILNLSRRLLVVTLLPAVLTACQSLPDGSSTDAEVSWHSSAEFFAERRQYTQSLSSWRYSAKVGLSTPDLNEQANLIWEFADQANGVRMFGPLGMGAIKLQFDEYGVQLSDNNGLLHRGASAEQLLTRIVGWPIPIDSLSSWMFVLPAKESAYRYTLDQNQQIDTLEQLGWLIKYSDYRDYDGQSMPRKIVATKNLSHIEKGSVLSKKSAPVNRQIVVKLITKGWTL